MVSNRKSGLAVSRNRFFLSLVAASLLVAPNVQAHLGHIVDGAERYIKFDAQPDGLRVVVSMTYGPSATVRVMGDADTNDDGEVGRVEADAYMRRWAQALREGLVIRVDGQAVDGEWSDAYFDPFGRVRRVSGAVEMVVRLPLPPGDHEIEVLDRMATDRIDRTDIAFREAPNGILLGGGSISVSSPPPAIAYGPTTLQHLRVHVRIAGILFRSLSLWVGGAIFLLLVLGALVWRVMAPRRMVQKD